MAGGRQCAPRSTITPTKTCSADLYSRIKRRVGAHLNEHTARGTWSLPESKQHMNYLELKVVLLNLKEFQDLCQNNTVLIATDNTTVIAYINKEGGMKSGPLCALLWRILTWCSRSLSKPDIQASGSRQAIQTKPDYSHRMVTPPQGLPDNMQEVAQAPDRPVCNQVQQEAGQICVTSTRPPGLGNRCTQPVMGGSGSICLPNSSHLWQSGGEIAGLSMQENHCDCSRLAQHALVLGLGSHVRPNTSDPTNLLTQPFNQTLHRNLSNVNLHTWLLKPQQSRGRASLRQWQHELRLLRWDQPDQSMRQSGPFLQSGASVIRWTLGHHL